MWSYACARCGRQPRRPAGHGRHAGHDVCVAAWGRCSSGPAKPWHARQREETSTMGQPWHSGHVQPSAESGRGTPRRRRTPATAQTLGLVLDRAPGAPPLYRQIRDGVRSAVLAGALGAGTRLPPERELAPALGVNRTTITRAYQELAADGVVEARPGRGTVICPPLPTSGETGSAGRAAAWPGATLEPTWLLGLSAFGHGGLGPDPGLLRDLTALSARDDVISFAAGTPAPDLLPLDRLQDLLHEGLARAGAGA